MMKRIKMALMIALCFLALDASAQKVAVKTNLLYDATSTINLGVEFALTPKWTLDVAGNYNPWTFSNNRKWQHWLVQPEARYWFCNKMMGHFVGFHAIAGSYNIGNVNADFKLLGTDFSKLKDYRYEGWFVGTGVAYGYAWTLSSTGTSRLNWDWVTPTAVLTSLNVRNAAKNWKTTRVTTMWDQPRQHSTSSMCSNRPHTDIPI